MEFETVTNPHLLSNNSIASLMSKVLLALLPAVLLLFYYYGFGVLTNIFLALSFALILEALVLRLRKRPIKQSLQDTSAVVTACLLALALPVASPYWLILIAVLFAIVFAKHLYGGLGENPFNPAMVGYVVVLISFPLEMSSYQALDYSFKFNLADTLQRVFYNPQVDATSAATILDYSQMQLNQGLLMAEIVTEPIFGSFAARGEQWVALLFALGGLLLLHLKVITWHAPCGMLASLGLLATIAYLLDASSNHQPLLHLFTTSTMLGAFFIITDPVSGATSNRGRLLFGVLVGVLVYVIRRFGSYADAVAFAVLLANMAAPTIDYFTKSKVYGAATK